jgi:hypothetical protein
MRTSDLIGHKIKGFDQTCVTDNTGRRVWTVDRVILDNGTVIVPSAVVMEDTYAVSFTPYKRKPITK